MTRLHYYDDDYWSDPPQEGLAAGALCSAIRGKRGQRFIRDLVQALDALPLPELAAGALEDEETGCCCAFGAVRRFRGAHAVPLWFHPMEEDMTPGNLAEPFNVSKTLAWAVVQANEDGMTGNNQSTRRFRWKRVRDWAVRQLIPTTTETP
jgi:hypothetical protein